jgi:hypothetical protein
MVPEKLVDTRSGKQNYRKRTAVSVAFHREYSRYRDFLKEWEVV